MLSYFITTHFCRYYGTVFVRISDLRTTLYFVLCFALLMGDSTATTTSPTLSKFNFASKVTLQFVRHGQTVSNRDGYLVSILTWSCINFVTYNFIHSKQGQTDSPLTETGINEAIALGRSLRMTKIDRVYASDLHRAYHTAGIIVEQWDGSMQREIIKCPLVRELCFGIR
jgi:hypothetical protein